MKKQKLSIGEMLFQIVLVLVFTCLVFVCIYPFFYIFLVSISDPDQVARKAVTFFPLGFTLENYIQVLNLKGIPQAFFVSVMRTIVGTGVTLLFTSILAYTLTQKELPLRKFFYRLVVVSMYVNAGLIPWYLTMRTLGLKDNFLVYILPYAVSAYSMILIKTYIEQISTALQESAQADGAGYFMIYRKIILPVSIPILAAVAVFTAVSQWNLWTDNLLLVSTKSLKTLQLVLLEFLNQSNAIATEARSSGTISGSGVMISPFSIRMTVTMVVTIPVICIYPFLQKYFVKGIMLGSVKG